MTCEPPRPGRRRAASSLLPTSRPRPKRLTHPQTLFARDDQPTGSLTDDDKAARAGKRVIDDREPAAAPGDIRQEADGEPDRADGHNPDKVRVPGAAETAESVRRAQRALAELKQRRAIEDRRAADEARERDDELARWNADDHSAAGNEHATDADASASHRGEGDTGCTEPQRRCR
jgi:hypothetical protein